MSDFLQVDWLAFTFKTLDTSKIPFETFRDVFPELGFVLDEAVPSKIRSHYTNTLSWNDDIFIAYNTLDNLSEVNFDISEIGSATRLFQQGVNVQIPSHSLELFFNLFDISIGDDSAVPTMLQLLVDRGCQLSRIDLCYDDFDRTLDVYYYVKMWALKCIQSPFIRSITCMGEENHGYTMYVGSLKKRDKLLRIYDKWAESDGEVNSTRYEFELHADKARDICSMILDKYHDGIPFQEFLFGWIKVKPIDWQKTYSRIDNAPLDGDFEKFIMKDRFNAVLPLRIISRDRKERQKSVTHFVEYQALPSVAGYVHCFGMAKLEEMIKHHLKSSDFPDKFKQLKKSLSYSNEYFESAYSHYVSDGNPFL